MSSSPLLVFAMPEESQNFFSKYDILCTGVGKINATFFLTAHLMKSTPSIIINLGTAGSRKHKTGNVINCTRFVQRDMNAVMLGFSIWQTPFSKESIILSNGQTIEGLAQGICGTGDSFDNTEESNHFDVVDMEAYALALVCQRCNIPFLCLKYVSDNADENATKDFDASLIKTAEALLLNLNKSGY